MSTNPNPDPHEPEPDPAPDSSVPVTDPVPFTPTDDPVTPLQDEALKTGRPPSRSADDGKIGGQLHDGMPGVPNDPGTGGEAKAPGHDGPGVVPNGKG